MLKWIHFVTRLFKDRSLTLRLNLQSDELYRQQQHYRAVQLAAERIDAFRVVLTITTSFILFKEPTRCNFGSRPIVY
jgi:hypothetical protein